MSDLKKLIRLCDDTYAAGAQAREQGVKEAVATMEFNEADLGRKTILLIDDREIIGLTVGGALKEAGFHVLVAKDDKDALEKMRHERMDLLVCDRHIEHVDTMALLRSMRQNDRTADTLVLFLTKAYNPSDILEADRLGYVDFVPKPFDIDEFVMRCIRLLRSR